MTIDELLSLAGLTANDEIPVWDAEAADEPTKKITAQNLAASVKTLAGLVGEAEFTEQLVDKADVIVDTASGAIASFPDGAAVAAKDITIAIEPVQSGSGDPSPTNVRPISGWTGAKVANISDSEKQPYFAGLLNGTYGFVDLGTLNWILLSNGFRSEAFYSAKFMGQLICTKYTRAERPNYPLNTWNDKEIGIGNSQALPFILIKDLAYTDAAVFKAAMSGVYLVYELATPTTPIITKEQFELLLDKLGIGGGLIPISWQSEAGTVYGGTLDVTTGLLTVDTVKKTYTGSSSSTGYTEHSALFGVNPVAAGYTLETTNLKCNRLKPSNFSVATDNHVHFPNQSLVAFYVSESVSDWSTYLTANPIEISYKIGVPQTYQLTPVEIEMLLGDNNVWADTGDSTVTYRADTKLYIQKINAPTDDDMIADAQIASGRYFIVGGNLYRSTTTIPAGDAINPGSNCILTNLADALNALNT